MPMNSHRGCPSDELPICLPGRRPLEAEAIGGSVAALGVEEGLLMAQVLLMGLRDTDWD